MVTGLPSTLTLESLGIHDRSSDGSDSLEQSSMCTSDVESDSKDSPPSSPSHHSQVDDSPLDSPSSGPLWARQTLKFASDWVGDPSDTKQTHSQFQDALHIFIVTASNPQSVHEASGISKWDTVMQEEYSSLMRNHTWDLIPFSKGRKIIQCKWIYRTKFASFTGGAGCFIFWGGLFLSLGVLIFFGESLFSLFWGNFMYMGTSSGLTCRDPFLHPPKLRLWGGVSVVFYFFLFC